MKKIVMFICSAILLALSVFSFAGCGNNNELVMVTNAEFAPFEYKTGDEIKGIDIEIAKAIADELGMKLKIINTDFKVVITNVNQGQADIALAALTVSPDRAELINFSNTYFKASQYIIVKSDNTNFDNLTTAEEINNAITALGSAAKIGFQSGTTGEYYAKGDEDWGFNGFPDAVKEGSPNGALAVKEIINGRKNIVIIDELPAKALVKFNTGLKLINVALTEEEYAIAVNKSKPELLAKINTALENLKTSGNLKTILDKFINEYIDETIEE